MNLHHWLALFPVVLSAAVPPGQAAMGKYTTSEQCYAALKTEKDPVVRRYAFRRNLYDPKETAKAAEIGLRDSDPLIRVMALYEAFDRTKDPALLKRTMKDPFPMVQKRAAELAMTLSAGKEKNEILQFLVKNGGSAEVRQAASRGIGFNFYRLNKPLSEDPANDHDVSCLKKVDLPVDGWAFKPDPAETGHLQGWFMPKFNDASWKRIRVNDSWEPQGFPGYDGIGWYRKNFFFPAEPKGNVYEICFEAVDESAYVWLNGIYVGQHDIGPDGWRTPFRLDVTKELIRGGENVLTVRVLDTEGGGGVWKPVHIEIMKAIAN